ncbi:2-phospho-L-lactate guanylyltransferase [Nocardioides daeguensis]|uniref:2-phospho-L-lactate guanylyltransferase n=1 Tax=Nocardioides daeguensis TaxID=908359 RepID=A0ABP6VLU3_9ACTN|nr:2-phospho-L-lactate guanylyltransferase [Nocardioides daeguensis]MBV6727303.1 2-phospho-L-lactate guanylyltransferase [Nocardioides daeguensis]MCR1775392.1 2-phospho-L-lactate guanylyltransferase [Nocardioides daeguensis]
MFTRPGSFAVLLPVKSPGNGKSRLSTLRDAERARLAAAFATDVVDACLRTDGLAGVLVVSDDAGFAATLGARGAATCADPGGGLNAALRHAAAYLHRLRPDLRPVALCADLPSLVAGDLAAALGDAASGAGPCFVRDADGTGTTLYSATYDRFDPHFGAGSAAAHAGSGARALAGDLPTLRRDVDDVDSLADAIALGVGESSAAVLRAIGLLPH